MRSPEEVAREIRRLTWDVLGNDGLVEEDGPALADLIRARDAEVAEAAKAENARLRAGIEALHGAVQEFEPCPAGPWGCGELTCTESVHTGERYHDDQPTGRVCLTCRYEDGEPHDWPCESAALLNPGDEP